MITSRKHGAKGLALTKLSSTVVCKFAETDKRLQKQARHYSRGNAQNASKLG